MNARSFESHAPQGRFQRGAAPWIVACVMLAVIAMFFVLREHWEHVAGKWPYLLLLACPLMHVFMHGGHDHGSHHAAEGDDRPKRQQ